MSNAALSADVLNDDLCLSESGSDSEWPPHTHRHTDTHPYTQTHTHPYTHTHTRTGPSERSLGSPTSSVLVQIALLCDNSLIHISVMDLSRTTVCSFQLFSFIALVFRLLPYTYQFYIAFDALVFVKCESV